jgi:hypothetical protein
MEEEDKKRSFIKKEVYFGKTVNITRPSKKTPIRYRICDVGLGVRYRLGTIIDNAYTKHLLILEED